MWHLVYEPKGSRISYVDDRLRKIEPEASIKVSMQDINNKRHIIGWCSDIVDLTGKSNEIDGIWAQHADRLQDALRQI